MTATHTDQPTHPKVRFFLSEADRSHDDIGRILRHALNPSTDIEIDPERYRFVREVYDDYLVYMQGDKLFKRSYTIADDEAVTFGEAEQVREVTTFEPVAESAPAAEPVTEPPAVEGGVLLEAVDDEGWNWRVQIIRAGVSANGNEYPLEVLREAAPVYSGVPAYYGRGRDHNPNERGFGSVAGWIVDPQPNTYGIEATLEIDRGKPEVRESIRHAWDVKQRTGRETFGFSHVIPRGGAIVESRKPHGKRVTRITRAESVDIVMTPAAGGALIAPLSEAAGDVVPDALQEAIMDIEKLLGKLRAGERIGTDELSHLQQAITPEALAEAIEERRKAAGPEEDAEPMDKPAEPVTESDDEGAEPVLTEAERKANEVIARLERRERELECASLLSRKLAESRLPDVMKDAIRADFADRLFEEAELTSRLERDRELASRLMEARPHGLGRVEITQDERDKHVAAMDGMFGMVRNDDGGDDISRSWHRTPVHFRNLREAYEAITGRRVTDARQILTEAVQYVPKDADWLAESIQSSTFGEILGDSIRRRMIAEYMLPDLQSYNELVSEVSNLQDFRTNHRVRLGGYGDLPVVAEGGTYNSLASPGDEEVTYAPEKRGGLEDITMETILNDDMQVVRQIPIKLGRAAVGTLRRYIFLTILRDNATIFDSKALFHNDHGNLGGTALSAAAMTTTRAAMRAQKPYGNETEFLGAANIPRRLFVPSDLEEMAFKIATSGPYVMASTEDATTPNIHRGINVTVVDEWTDATDWMAAADPNNTPLLEIGYLNGREEPELFVQDAQTVGSVFSADKVTYKIRHIWGVVPLDFRGLYKHVVSD